MHFGSLREDATARRIPGQTFSDISSKPIDGLVAWRYPAPAAQHPVVVIISKVHAAVLAHSIMLRLTLKGTTKLGCRAGSDQSRF